MRAIRHPQGDADELASQMPILKEVLAALNIPMYELDGWEADDLIGTISVKDTAAGWETVVVTGDKDSLQLVTETTTVKLVSTRMGRTATRDMTPETFQEEYGFGPIHIIDLKALMGDASDNIPGVKGVGEKTAMALVQRYGSIDLLYAAMPEIEMAAGTPAKPGVVKKLAEGEEMARMSYDLATIRTDAPIEFTPEANLRREPDRAACTSSSSGWSLPSSSINTDSPHPRERGIQRRPRSPEPVRARWWRAGSGWRSCLPCGGGWTRWMCWLCPGWTPCAWSGRRVRASPGRRCFSPAGWTATTSS